jgi:hypothetical protein
MRTQRNTILIFLAILPVLVGCGKDTPRRDESTGSTASDSAGTQSEPAKGTPAAWPRPFSPTAPPPLAAGPSATRNLTPTQYADARVGMKALYRVIPERGGSSRQTLEIVRTDAATAYAHQTAETKKYGGYVQHMAYNRFVEGPPAIDRFNPTYREHYVGDRIVAVGSKELLCRVYEVKNGSSVYRTLLCDDVPGKLVQHSDNAAGVWKPRLQLLDVWD